MSSMYHAFNVNASSGGLNLPQDYENDYAVHLPSPDALSFSSNTANDNTLDSNDIDNYQKFYTRPDDGLSIVAVMLPLSGKTGKVGASLKQAAELALFSANNKNVVLQFYDTANAVNGIEAMTKQAMKENADVILGPLFGGNTAQVAKVANRYGVPVLSFSNDETIISDYSSVYSLNYLLSQEIDRIIGFSSSMGKKNIAFIIPDGKYEDIITSAIEDAVSKYGSSVYNIVTYEKSNQKSIVEAVKIIS